MKTTFTASEEAQKAIKTWMTLSEKFRNSYFWKSPMSASSRRHMEQVNSFKYEDEHLSLSFSISCSCKNIYVNKSVSIDGKPTNATALKKFIS